MKHKKSEPIIEESLLVEMKQNEEWSKPKLRGELLPTGRPTVVIRAVKNLLKYQPPTDKKKPFNWKRLTEDSARISTINKQFKRKSNGEHNVQPIKPLPVIVYFKSEPNKEFIASGYGRCENFMNVGQEKYAFLRYEIQSPEQLEAMMVHFNVEPEGNNLSVEELVTDLVDVIKKNPKIDIDRYIEDTYVHTDSKVVGKIKESANEMIAQGHTPKYYRNIDKKGHRWDDFVDKAQYPYLHFKEVKNDWYGKTILYGSYSMYRDGFFNMFERWDTNKLKTKIYLDTKMPTGKRNLCEMRLKCFNDIYKDWFFMCDQYGKPRRRKIFKIEGFHPTDYYNEIQTKLVKINDVLKLAKEYLKLGYKEFDVLIYDCEKYLRSKI